MQVLEINAKIRRKKRISDRRETERKRRNVGKMKGIQVEIKEGIKGMKATSTIL